MSTLFQVAKAIQSKAEQQLTTSMKNNEKYWTANSEGQIATLSPDMQRIVRSILKYLTGKGWHPVVVHGARSPAQQAKKVRDGVSKTTHSLHVPGEHQNKQGRGKERMLTTLQAIVSQHGPYTIKGEAADIVDARWGWEGPCHDQGHAFWNDLGCIAKSLKLVWGGDWQGASRDVAHVELQRYEVGQDTRGSAA
jgi:hypothetical protein